MSSPGNLIKFTTSTSLMITSYALISITNFLLVSQHIFTTTSRVKDGTELALFVTALAITAINCMLLLYIKSRKMPKQGINLGAFRPLSGNFGPMLFTIFQLILMALLIALFVLSNTTLDTTTKVFIIFAQVILNIGQIAVIWSYSSTECRPFYPMRPGINQGYNQGYDQGYNQGGPMYDSNGNRIG